jgi:predicted Abi (CAAX) family protease
MKGFDKALAVTTHYRELLTKMKPMMVSVFEKADDPDKLAAVVEKALEAKRPRLQYRVSSGALLSVMEILPEKGMDLLYKMMFKMGRKNKQHCES